LYAYLTLHTGSRKDRNYLLKEGPENRIGRGLDCSIVLSDPSSSRVHAVIIHREGAWWVRDAESSNGTYVNGQKVDEAQLAEGCSLKTGATEFTFHQSGTAPAELASADPTLTQTIIHDAPVQPDAVDGILMAIDRPEGTRDLLLLHQLSIKLLGMEDPDEVVSESLDLLHQNTKASVVGFLWVSDDGELKPKLLIPSDATRKVKLSKSLTEVVCRKRHAVWIDDRSLSRNTGTLDHFADAICVPLVHERLTLGAIHMYLERGRFTENDFDFSISLANMLVVALARARHGAILAAQHRRLVAKSAEFDELLGESEPMLRLKGKINKVARAAGCVLIRGESGVGKELVARAVHRASSRSDRPMLSVNCAAIPPDLMESQLFGHKRGAFSAGSNRPTPGRFSWTRSVN